MQTSQNVEFIPPPNATKIQINSNLMGWVDPHGVVLHSWRKTKRGTRGGGQRRRQEAEDAVTASAGQAHAEAPGPGQSAAAREQAVSLKGSAGTVTPKLNADGAREVSTGGSVIQCAQQDLEEESSAEPPQFVAEDKLTPVGRDEHGMPTSPHATAVTPGASPSGARLLTPRLTHDKADKADKAAGSDEEPATPKASASATTTHQTPEVDLPNSAAAGRSESRVRVPTEDWEHLQQQNDQVRLHVVTSGCEHALAACTHTACSRVSGDQAHWCVRTESQHCLTVVTQTVIPAHREHMQSGEGIC